MAAIGSPCPNPCDDEDGFIIEACHECGCPCATCKKDDCPDDCPTLVERLADKAMLEDSGEPLCPDCGENDEDCTCGDQCSECGCAIDDCDCERCNDCGKLTDDCECDKCETCGKSTAECKSKECEIVNGKPYTPKTFRPLNTSGIPVQSVNRFGTAVNAIRSGEFVSTTSDLEREEDRRLAAMMIRGETNDGIDSIARAEDKRLLDAIKAWKDNPGTITVTSERDINRLAQAISDSKIENDVDLVKNMEGLERVRQKWDSAQTRATREGSTPATDERFWQGVLAEPFVTKPTAEHINFTVTVRPSGKKSSVDDMFATTKLVESKSSESLRLPDLLF